ncbi:hypothetical protein FACS1894204_12180 [Synergistales bacterium]|nr:hypothetical protein FACS1894204_12180 [Synergistales bacterium]
MKKIVIEEQKCSACGACVLLCDSLLEEDEDGKAVVISGGVFNETDANTFQEVTSAIEACPSGALTLVDSGNARELSDLIKRLRDEADKFTVKKVSAGDIKLKAADFDVSVPHSVKGVVTDYTSERQALSAARDEFNRLCNSESAYRPILKKIFVEYKMKFLKPYYTFDGSKDSAYSEYNKKIGDMLSEIYVEAQGLCGDGFSLPENWKEFNVSLKSDECYMIGSLENFDELSTKSGVIADFKSRGEYTETSWYIDQHIKVTSYAWYLGEGLFGRSKFKTKYNYDGFNSAAKEYVSDLMSSLESVSVEDGAADSINSILNEFEKKVKEVLQHKISALEHLSNASATSNK